MTTQATDQLYTLAGRRKRYTLEAALRVANATFKRTGVIVSIEAVKRKR